MLSEQISRDAPLADFETIASRYPVFRVERRPAARHPLPALPIPAPAEEDVP
jgi:hypothetical protein